MEHTRQFFRAAASQATDLARRVSTTLLTARRWQTTTVVIASMLVAALATLAIPTG